MSFAEKFVSAVKIAAQTLPLTAALSQWLDEIDSGRIKARLNQLEDPLANYGPQAKQLTKILYSLIKSQQQDHPTTHIDWVPELNPFIKEIRRFEASGFLTGSHAMGREGEFTGGFRLNNPAFIVLLALTHDDPEENARLFEILDNAKDHLSGFHLRKSLNLPLVVINAYFSIYAARGQGLKSGEIGSSIYSPKK